jgi:hypothetical protein
MKYIVGTVRVEKEVWDELSRLCLAADTVRSTEVRKAVHRLVKDMQVRERLSVARRRQ